MVEISKTPIDDFQTLILRIHQYIPWLDITMYDTPRMRVVQTLQYLIDVHFNRLFRQCWIKTSEVLILNVLKDE